MIDLIKALPFVRFFISKKDVASIAIWGFPPFGEIVIILVPFVKNLAAATDFRVACP